MSIKLAGTMQQIAAADSRNGSPPYHRLDAMMLHQASLFSNLLDSSMRLDDSRGSTRAKLDLEAARRRSAFQCDSADLSRLMQASPNRIWTFR